MRLNLWLAQPETERKLVTALRVVMIAFACWAMATAYLLWNTRSALAASHSSVVSQNKRISEVTRELPHKRTEAAKAVRVEYATPESATNADLTNELSRIAQITGAEIAGVRIGDGGQGKATAQSGTGPVNTTSTSPNTAATNDGWDQETFECNIAGEYGTLTQFLNVLAASHHVLDITAVDVTQVSTKTQTDTPQLDMKLSGIVYELPEKP